MLRFFLSMLVSSILISFQDKDIMDTLDGYNEAFGEADYSKIISFFDYPASFNLQDKTITAANRFKLRLIYKKMRGGLPDYYSYSKWDKIDVALIDDNIAVVYADFSRYDNNDSIFYSGSAIYHLRFKNNKWKIFSLTPYKSIKSVIQ